MEDGYSARRCREALDVEGLSRGLMLERLDLVSENERSGDWHWLSAHSQRLKGQAGSPFSAGTA